MDGTSKRCGKCGETKTLDGFYRNAARYDGVSGYCIPCQRAKDTAHEQRQRAEMLALLGGQCKDCGFTNPLALQVDHVNGGGGAERRGGSLSPGPGALLRAVKARPGEFQLLCANCNIIKRLTQGEHVGDRRYHRVVLATLVPRDRSRTTARYAAVEAKRAEFLALIEERRTARTSATRLPRGSWSRFWLGCLGCERSDRRHAAQGLCYACNARVKRNYASG